MDDVSAPHDAFLREIVQTFIDRYIEQDRLQGRQEGVRAGEAALLLHLIERKLGAPSEATRQRITRADPETLLCWSERILTADSLDAVLHYLGNRIAGSTMIEHVCGGREPIPLQRRGPATAPRLTAVERRRSCDTAGELSL